MSPNGFAMRKAAVDLKGRTALVTGAASGIGRAVAVTLSRRGVNLALVDIDLKGLAETRSLLAPGVVVSQHHLDLAVRAAIAALPHDVRSAHGDSLDLLFNVAGVALGGHFAEVKEADFDWLFDINFFGTVRMTRAFLPMLERSTDARIVNISSIYGIISPPGQTAYSASKFAVRGFSNALAKELADKPIGVTVVHPGGVATAIADRARGPEGRSPQEIEEHRRAANAMLKMPAEKAGEIIVAGVEARKSRILVGNDARIAALLERLFPTSYWSIIAALKGKRS